MRDGTKELERIVGDLEALVADVKAGRVYLPDVGRVVCSSISLRATVNGHRERVAQRAARQASISLGGMDHSVPAGDRG